MVIGNVVRTSFALHAAHGRFARVPEMTVVDGDIFGVAFRVDRSIAFFMVVTALLSIEYVDVVNPNVGVVSVKRNAVVHLAHDTQVAHFHALAVADEKTESPDGCILADALYGDVHFAVSFSSFHLNAYFGTSKCVGIAITNSTDDTHVERNCHIAFLISTEDSLNACEGAAVELCLDSFGIGFCDIHNHGVLLERAIVVVGSYARIVLVGKTYALEVLHDDSRCLVGLCCEFLTFYDWHHFQGIVGSCYQSDSIGTSVGAVVSDELSIQLCPVGIGSTFYIYSIVAHTFLHLPFHVG